MTPITENKPKPHRTQSPAQARAAIQGLINLVLVIMTVRDIRRRSDAELNGSRKRWLLAAFAPPFGPIAYLIFGRKHHPQPTDILLETPIQS
jgi:hypothetical protein